MKIHESAEDYLESILVLQQRLGQVRSIDIVNELNFSKPSVSRAMGLLKEGGYIAIDKEGFITLTDSGLEVAQKIYERHTILSTLLVALGVSPETAAEDACRIEHAISDESFQALKRFAAKME